MPFFPQVYLSPEANFLQILSELDQPREKQAKSCVARQQQPAKRQPTFIPRFDVTETEQAYELYGEVPGLEQKDLSIEFSDAQTLLVQGKTERTSSTTQTEKTNDAEMKDAETSSDASSVKSHNPTVEDDYDEADAPITRTTPATETTTPTEQPQQKQTETPKPKFWVSERKVGSFARSFSFTQRLEHDKVDASLKNGVLHVVVPKSVKRSRVSINVY
ncbi:uncharacterized protein BP5553_06370 [Venustampulla echinocandica]|uniref:SHSP domain-containing protein n=1 Tax=Venustampulla echinocandica TaxID=2656787 RepID=A0A370TJQ5_9HELO|nr:uncharacterized protein BP5553_06370 [Venustampulla echinocandica]RDL35758.1 hypothetical protein BP5553_06370 [Venustampulla echinocandica]